MNGLKITAVAIHATIIFLFSESTRLQARIIAEVVTDILASV